MAKDDTKRISLRAPLTLVCVAAVLAGCSSVPDAMNPAEWYKSTVDLMSGEDTQSANGGLSADPAAPPPASSFPNLASVPERPSGLSSDGESKVYASSSIPRQGEAQNALADEAPAPPAAPVIAVTPVPVTPQVAPMAPLVADAAPAQPQAPRPAPVASGVQTPSIQVPQAPAQLTPPARPSIVAEAPAPVQIQPALPSADALMIGGDPFETVVISGEGLQTTSDTVTASLPNVAGDPAFPGTQAAASTSEQALTVDGALRVATIVFSNGSANISHNDRQILAEVGQLLRERGGSLHVVGHASARTRNMDPVQHKLVNFQVSADRADTVANELQQLGVPKGLITVAAASDSQPLYYEIMPSGEAGNRRAEIYLVQ